MGCGHSWEVSLAQHRAPYGRERRDETQGGLVQVMPPAGTAKGEELLPVASVYYFEFCKGWCGHRAALRGVCGARLHLQISSSGGTSLGGGVFISVHGSPKLGHRGGLWKGKKRTKNIISRRGSTELLPQSRRYAELHAGEKLPSGPQIPGRAVLSGRLMAKELSRCLLILASQTSLQGHPIKDAPVPSKLGEHMRPRTDCLPLVGLLWSELSSMRKSCQSQTPVHHSELLPAHSQSPKVHPASGQCCQ